jgi:gamma-glutamyltranspeptidase / glutathione hydrolase
VAAIPALLPMSTAARAPGQEPTAAGIFEAGRAPDGGTWRAMGTHGAVAAGGQEAVEAGLTVLKAGGNAADAAVATVLALAITDARSFGFGGEVPILVSDARRRVVEVVCGQGAAPRLATRDSFAARGGIPGIGPEPAAALDACLTTLDRYGTRTFAEVVAPALRILDRRAQP